LAVIEAYIKAHSEAQFTHGICPECMKKLYPEFPSLTVPKLEINAGARKPDRRPC